MTVGRATARTTPCGSVATVDTRFHMLEIAALDRPHAALHAVISRFGLATSPPPGHATGGATLTLFHAARRRWWLRTDAAASVPSIPGLVLTDISDALVCLRVQGATSRDWAGRYCPLDLRPRSFRPRQVTWTRFAEVRTLLHCVDSDIFDLYLGASYAADVFDCCLTAKALA